MSAPLPGWWLATRKDDGRIVSLGPTPLGPLHLPRPDETAVKGALDVLGLTHWPDGDVTTRFGARKGTGVFLVRVDESA